ncbi:MAG: hypothetical protein ABJH07_15800 [Sedimentitalea sp.]|uniref:hypothetical protein n=1 Tax=Sedimentitalea sp. TaxID=2048915 RepID=UPI003263B1EE
MKQDFSQSVDEAGWGNLAPARFLLSETVGGIAAVQADFSQTADNSGLFYIYVLDAGRIGGAVSFFRGDYLGIPSAACDGAIYNFISKRIFRVYLMHWYSLNMPIFSDRAAEV